MMSEVQPPSQDNNFLSLCESVRAGRCTAYIGSGMSAPDAPSWPSLMQSIIQSCEINPEDPPSNDYKDIAEFAQSKNPDQYFRTITDMLKRKSDPYCQDNYHALCRCGFTEYVNFNFDNYLFHYLNIHKNLQYCTYPVLRRPERNAYNSLIHIHGHIPDDKSARDCQLVMTSSEFNKAYGKNEFVFSLLRELLLTSDACFIGFNPEEPVFLELIKICKEIADQIHDRTSPDCPKWYWLRPYQHPTSTVEPDLADSEVLLAKYDRVDSNYTGLTPVLQYMADMRPPTLIDFSVRARTSLYTPTTGLP